MATRTSVGTAHPPTCVTAALITRTDCESARIAHDQKLKPLVCGCIHTGTNSVRLDEDVYERIAAHKRDDETFSAAISRLTSDYSLLAAVDGSSDAKADRHCDLLAEADATTREDRREQLQRPADTE